MAASAWWTHVYHLDYGTIDARWLRDAFEGWARTTFVVLPYVYLAVLCATVFRSAGQAVGAALGVYFIESIFTGILTGAEGWPSHIPAFLLNFNGESLMRANGSVTVHRRRRPVHLRLRRRPGLARCSRAAQHG